MGTHVNDGHALSRRRLLALAALATVPAAACSNNRDAGPDTGLSGPEESAEPSPTPVRPVTKGGGAVPIKPGKVRLGAYLALKDLSLSAALALRHRQLGRDESIVQRFYQWDDTLPRTLPVLPERSTLMIAWGGTRYADIIGGKSDRLIAAAGRQMARRNRPTLLRWGWDMNRDFYAWGGPSNGRTAAGYVKSWQRVHRIFADEGADRVSWVWSPNWNSHPDAAWNTIAHYYPGDAYVDWVGVSGYADTETPADMYDPVYQAYAGKKPIMLTEVGVMDHGGRTKADWIIGFAEWVKSRPGIGAVVWFDTDTHPGSTEKWRIDSNKQALAAYRAMADDPAFGG
jgi:hypothetical protein